MFSHDFPHDRIASLARLNATSFFAINFHLAEWYTEWVLKYGRNLKASQIDYLLNRALQEDFNPDDHYYWALCSNEFLSRDIICDYICAGGLAVSRLASNPAFTDDMIKSALNSEGPLAALTPPFLVPAVFTNSSLQPDTFLAIFDRLLVQSGSLDMYRLDNPMLYTAIWSNIARYHKLPAAFIEAHFAELTETSFNIFSNLSINPAAAPFLPRLSNTCAAIYDINSREWWCNIVHKNTGIDARILGQLIALPDSKYAGTVVLCQNVVSHTHAAQSMLDHFVNDLPWPGFKLDRCYVFYLCTNQNLYIHCDSIQPILDSISILMERLDMSPSDNSDLLMWVMIQACQSGRFSLDDFPEPTVVRTFFSSPAIMKVRWCNFLAHTAASHRASIKWSQCTKTAAYIRTALESLINASSPSQLTNLLTCAAGHPAVAICLPDLFQSILFNNDHLWHDDTFRAALSANTGLCPRVLQKIIARKYRLNFVKLSKNKAVY